jgi:hypothetical protein
MLLNTKQALDLAGNAPGRQPEPLKVDVDSSAFGQLSNLTAESAELLKVLGGNGHEELPVRT